MQIFFPSLRNKAKIMKIRKQEHFDSGTEENTPEQLLFLTENNVTMTEKRLDLFKFWIHERPPDPDSMIESRGVIDVNKRGYMFN